MHGRLWKLAMYLLWRAGGRQEPAAVQKMRRTDPTNGPTGGGAGEAAGGAGVLHAAPLPHVRGLDGLAVAPALSLIIRLDSPRRHRVVAGATDGLSAFACCVGRRSRLAASRRALCMHGVDAFTFLLCGALFGSLVVACGLQLDQLHCRCVTLVVLNCIVTHRQVRPEK